MNAPANPDPPTLQRRWVDACGLASLGVLGLMACVPFLMPHHRHPIPTFFQEWWSIVLGLVATLALAFPRNQTAFPLPRIAFLPLALAGIVLFQSVLMPQVRGDSALIGVLYLGWATLLMSVARSLMATHGAPALATALAVGIATGALGSSLVVALQWGDALRGTGLISAPIGNRLFGNLNQPNHLSLQLWLGIAALLYLFARRRLPLGPAFIAAALLALASLLSGSRAVLAYAVALPLLALLQHRGRQSDRSTLALAFAVLATALLGHIAFSVFAEPAGPVTLAQREWGKDGHAVRFGLWWMGAQMGLEHPLSGVGWGRFSPESFNELATYGASAPASLILVPGEHAHNIFVQLLAETGVPGPLLVIFFGLSWLWGILRRPLSGESFLALSLIALLTLHAQVEYTLWYAFFLGIAALALALGEQKDLRVRTLRPSLVLVILLAAFATAGLLRNDYKRLETTMQWPLGEFRERFRPWSAVSAELLELRQHSRFGAYVDLALVGSMQFDRELVSSKLALCDAAIGFSPTDYAVFKCAALLALDGRADAALARLERAMLAYPEDIADFIRLGEALLAEHPELEPLIAAARAHGLSRGLVETETLQ